MLWRMPVTTISSTAVGAAAFAAVKHDVPTASQTPLRKTPATADPTLRPHQEAAKCPATI